MTIIITVVIIIIIITLVIINVWQVSGIQSRLKAIQTLHTRQSLLIASKYNQ